MWMTNLMPPWPFESTIDAVLDNDQLVLLSENHRCLPQFLQPHIWLLHLVEIIVSVLSIFLNGISGVSTFYAITIPSSIRQTFAIISLNYAFLSAACLVKKCFLLLSVYYPCITVASVLSCKLQEFPIVIIYFHGAILPLTLAAQMCFFRRAASERVFNSDYTKKGLRDNDDEFIVGAFNWTRCCSVNESIILIICVGLSIYFTAFDTDLEQRFLLKCSILMALKERSMAFWMITILILLHCLGAVVWPLITADRLLRVEQRNQSCRKSSPIQLSSSILLLSPPASKPLVRQIAQSYKIVMHSRRHLSSRSANKLPAIAEEGALSPTPSNSAVPLFDSLSENEKAVQHYVHVGEWQPQRSFTNAENDAEFRQRIALNYLKLSFRDVLLYESSFWLISFLVTGSTLVYQYVAQRVCSKCIFLSIELSFTLFPLLIALSHAPLCIWLVMPIRQATICIFPTLFGWVLPSMEPETPPLPNSHRELTSNDDYPPSSVRIMVTRYDGDSSPSSTTSIFSGKSHG